MNKNLFIVILLAAIVIVLPSKACAADSLAALVQLLNSSTDAQFQLDLLRGMGQAMEGRAQVPMPGGWEGVESKLARSESPEIRSLALALGLKFGSPTALSSLQATLKNASANASERRNALKALLSVKDAELPAMLQSLLKDTVPSGDAIRGLAAFNDAKTPDALLAVYASFDDAGKRDAVNTLASRAAYARPLMAAVEQGTVPKAALTADLLRQLRNLKDEQVNAAIQKTYGTFRETTADKQKLIAKFKTVYSAGGSTPGDAPRGRVVFNRICVQCHTLFDVGSKVGPDLTGSNRGDLDYLLQNMVDPNAVIPNEYRSVTVDMKDDRVVTGVLKNQDQNSMTVATANELLVLPRKEIASIFQGELSMMPENLLDTLNDQEFRDLIYYLRQPVQASLPEEPPR